jgi:hypothetical protein
MTRRHTGIRVHNPSFLRNMSDDDEEEDDGKKAQKIHISIPFGGGGGGDDGEGGYPGGGGGGGGDGDGDDEEEGQYQGGGKGGGKGGTVIIYVPGGGTGPVNPWEDPPDETDVTRSEEENMRREVAKRVIEERITRAGDASSNVLTWAKSVLSPKTDWRSQLRAAIANAIVYVQGFDEPTRSREGRRESEFFIAPGTREPVPEVAVVLDSSGSMTQAYRGMPRGINIMDQAIAELDAILSSFNTIGIPVYVTDTAVAWCKRVWSMDQVSITDNMGGTNLKVGIDAAYNAETMPQVIIVLTDGQCVGWPEKNKYQEAQIIAGIIGFSKQEIEEGGNKPPRFIEPIYIY